MVELKKVVGTGAQATVYCFDKHAYKLFKEGYSKTPVFYEALINSIVEDAGLPVPKTYEVLSIDGHMAIKMDYIEGIPLADYMKKDTHHTASYFEKMIKLQVEVNSKRVILPFSLKNRLNDKVKGNENFSIAQKEKILKILKRLPDGNELCHGDFHGLNVLVRDEKYWIIDWVDATCGCADGDACRTYMIYALNAPEYAGIYLTQYCRETQKERGQILEWLPVVAAARLSENIAGEEKKIMDLIHENL